MLRASIVRSCLPVLLVAVLAHAGCGESDTQRAAREAAEAKAAAEEAAQAKARADVAAANEAERLKALWIYSDTTAGRAGKGREISAQIRSTNDVDTDGTGGRRVLLVFRDHAVWGRSSYLVLGAGDFRCSPRCSVSVTFGAQALRTLPAHRPNTDEAIALFIDDWRALWAGTAGAGTLTVEFPVKAGGVRSATFDVAGLDRAKMPNWDRLSGLVQR